MPARDFRKPQFVVPGEDLCVAEEFLPGPGTYESGGVVYSDATGERVADLMERKVKVVPKVRTPVMPTDGSTVIGEVSSAHDKSAIVSIYKVDSEVLGRPFTGILHISSSSPRYERNMEDVCKTGDLIKAKVFNDKNRIPELTTSRERARSHPSILLKVWRSACHHEPQAAMSAMRERGAQTLSR